jgi:hypothetical protein
MAQKPPDLPPIELDMSVEETMEIVGINDDSATPVPSGPTAVRRVGGSSSRPATSPVPTAPLEVKAVGALEDADALSAEELQLVEAIRQSLEKAAHALRAVAQLCVEKRVIAPNDLRRSR